jgi:molybdopterin molybdotransferase
VNPVGKPGKTGSLMPVEVALARLLELADNSRIVERERLPLAQVEGRCWRTIWSTLDLPPWPNSAMDGYALPGGLDGRPLPVSQKIFAGQAPEPLQPGTCAGSSPVRRCLAVLTASRCRKTPSSRR